MNTKQKRRVKARLPQDACYYCDGSFNCDDYPHFPRTGEPYAKKTRRWIAPTLEHIQARSKGGKLQNNSAIAHAWCNVAAGNLSVEEKQALRGDKMRELIKSRDSRLLRKIAINFEDGKPVGLREIQRRQRDNPTRDTNHKEEV